MNQFLRDRILRKLDTLSDERLYQVLDYVEFLESKYAERQNPTANVFQRFALDKLGLAAATAIGCALDEAATRVAELGLTNAQRRAGADATQALIDALEGRPLTFTAISPAVPVLAEVLGIAAADAREALSAVPGVTGVTVSDTRGAATGFEVATAADRDVRRELASTVVGRGWGLLELRPMRMSLEEIFLSLTTEETEAPAVAAGDQSA